MNANCRVVLTIVKPNGDKELRSFPFEPSLVGSEQASLERMELHRRKLGKDVRTTWEVISEREALGV